LPKIPDDLRSEAFKTKAIVRFYIDKNGNVKNLDFVRAASNPRLNSLLIKQLRKWKFEPTGNDYNLEINVEFEVS
jgi:periplasmic protein TonB